MGTSDAESVVTPFLLDNYMPIPESGCWLWMGTWDRGGYGKISNREAGKKSPVTHKAHRIFYAVMVGEIPDGLFVCHKCDARSCLNPAHLFLGTNQDNINDMYAKGRWKRRAPLENRNEPR
jgi:HNH endonuclease